MPAYSYAVPRTSQPVEKMTWREATKRFIYNRKAERSNFVKFATAVGASVRVIGLPVSAVTLVDSAVGMILNDFVWISFAAYAFVRIGVIRHQANKE